MSINKYLDIMVDLLATIPPEESEEVLLDFLAFIQLPEAKGYTDSQKELFAVMYDLSAEDFAAISDFINNMIED